MHETPGADNPFSMEMCSKPLFIDCGSMDAVIKKTEMHNRRYVIDIE